MAQKFNSPLVTNNGKIDGSQVYDEYASLVDTGEVPPKVNSKSLTHNTTESNKDSAHEEKTGRKLYIATVKAEQKANFLRRLSKGGVGTNRIESNQIKSRREMVCDPGRCVKDITNEMNNKVKCK